MTRALRPVAYLCSSSCADTMSEQGGAKMVVAPVRRGAAAGSFGKMLDRGNASEALHAGTMVNEGPTNVLPAHNRGVTGMEHGACSPCTHW